MTRKVELVYPVQEVYQTYELAVAEHGKKAWERRLRGDFYATSEQCRELKARLRPNLQWDRRFGVQLPTGFYVFQTLKPVAVHGLVQEAVPWYETDSKSMESIAILGVSGINEALRINKDPEVERVLRSTLAHVKVVLNQKPQENSDGEETT